MAIIQLALKKTENNNAPQFAQKMPKMREIWKNANAHNADISFFLFRKKFTSHCADMFYDRFKRRHVFLTYTTIVRS